MDIFEETYTLGKIKIKIQDPEYAFLMDYNIHNFLWTKTNKNWDFRKAKVVGIGRIIKSDTNYNWANMNSDDYDLSPQVLIIQSGEKNEDDADLSCLLLNPKGVIPLNQSEYFLYGYPTFQYIDIKDKNDGTKWTLHNIIDEMVEVKIDAFKNAPTVSELLNDHQLRVNDYMIENQTNGHGFIYLTEVLSKVKKMETEQKEKNKLIDYKKWDGSFDKKPTMKDIIINSDNEARRINKIYEMFDDNTTDLLSSNLKIHIGDFKDVIEHKDRKEALKFFSESIIDFEFWNGYCYWDDNAKELVRGGKQKDECCYEKNPVLWADLSNCLALGYSISNNEELNKKTLWNMLNDNYKQQLRIINKMIRIKNRDDKIAYAVGRIIGAKKLDVVRNKNKIIKLIKKEIRLEKSSQEFNGTTILAQLKAKIQDPEYAFLMDYNIHNFLWTKIGKSWSLRKAKLVGVGWIVKSDTDYEWMDEKYGDYDLFPQVLIIQCGNKNGANPEFSCLLLNPKGIIPLNRSEYLEFGYPTFEFKDAQTNKQNDSWVLQNMIGETIEVKIDFFKNPIIVSKLLNKHQLRINDYMISHMTDRYSFNYLSDVLEHADNSTKHDKAENALIYYKQWDGSFFKLPTYFTIFINPDNLEKRIIKIYEMFDGNNADSLSSKLKAHLGANKDVIEKGNKKNALKFFSQCITHFEFWNGYCYWDNKAKVLVRGGAQRDECSYHLSPILWADLSNCLALSYAIANNKDLNNKTTFKLLSDNYEQQLKIYDKMMSIKNRDEKIAYAVGHIIYEKKLDVVKDEKQIIELIKKEIRLEKSKQSN